MLLLNWVWGKIKTVNVVIQQHQFGLNKNSFSNVIISMSSKQRNVFCGCAFCVLLFIFIVINIFLHYYFHYFVLCKETCQEEYFFQDDTTWHFSTQQKHILPPKCQFTKWCHACTSCHHKSVTCARNDNQVSVVADVERLWSL